MKCDLCPKKECYQGKNCRNTEENIKEIYASPEDQRFLQVSTAIEGTFYMQKTRLEELIIFCQEMGYKRLGIAFCVGLEKETQTLCSYLRKHFEVYSVCCKLCGVAKEEFSLKKIKEDNYEAMCNPIMQAKVLKEKNTEINIVVGLCIGHDILFNKHSHVVATTLIVKDRILAHNPIGALYSPYYSTKF